MSADAEIGAPLAGYLSYDWTAEDTVAGSFLARFTITDTDGDTLTLPNSAGIFVEIS